MTCLCDGVQSRTGMSELADSLPADATYIVVYPQGLGDMNAAGAAERQARPNPYRPPVKDWRFPFKLPKQVRVVALNMGRAPGRRVVERDVDALVERRRLRGLAGPAR